MIKDLLLELSFFSFLFFFLSLLHTRNLLGIWARGSNAGNGRCIARDEQDKQPTGSAWPWHRICRGTLTRQTKHEAVSAGSSDGKWGVRRCCLPCGCSCMFASVISSTWWLWLNNILSGDTENLSLRLGLTDNACLEKWSVDCFNSFTVWLNTTVCIWRICSRRRI